VNKPQRYYREANRNTLSIRFSIFRYNLKSNKMEKNNHTFYHYINSACLAVGVIGSLLYLEVSPLQFGLAGIGLWSVTGILGMKAEKKANKKEN
jgi:hypothetical protein